MCTTSTPTRLIVQFTPALRCLTSRRDTQASAADGPSPPVLHSRQPLAGVPGATISVVYFNPLAWARTDAVNVTVPGTGGVRVTDSNGAAVVAQLVTTESGRREVVFVAAVPGIGFSTYFIETGASCAASETSGCAVPSVVDVRQGRLKRHVSDATFTLQNDHVVATFSNATGAVLQLHSLDSDTTVDVTQGIYQYINGTGGAYILVRTTLMPSGCVCGQ